jgi:hypothetical protein
MDQKRQTSLEGQMMCRNIFFFGILFSSFGFLAHASSAEESVKPTHSPEDRLKSVLFAINIADKDKQPELTIQKGRRGFKDEFPTFSILGVLDRYSTRRVYRINKHEYNNPQHFDEISDIYNKLASEEKKDSRGETYKTCRIDWGNIAVEPEKPADCAMS